MRHGWIIAVALLLAGCSSTTTTREVGHKGKAKVNPYLAAQRFLERMGDEILEEPGWPDFDGEVAMVLMPVSILSAEGYVDDLDEWVRWGGHAVVFLNHGESYRDDWSGNTWSFGGSERPEPFREWMRRLDVTVEESEEIWDDSGKTSAESVELEGRNFEVWMESWNGMKVDGESAMFVSREVGEGRVTVMADARPFRNRYIGDHEHAALLAELSEITPYWGPIQFVRNASLSFWKLLWARAWPFVIALIVVVLLWLWKNLPRFGPLDAVEGGGTLRAYDHHLEALGDFHWRLDRGEHLLRPLRESLLERAHRLSLSTGRGEVDVFALMAERAGIPRERAERAMTFERARDAGSFTRLVADLQKLHLSIP